jgi:SAM-dependent methyltransferase
MSLFYRVAYSLGLAPWEHAATHPPAAKQIAALFEREERGRRPPFGRALDLGCGRGHWSVVLAQRGWKVTGIDLVPKAVQAAQERAKDAGMEVRIVQGDVTSLRDAGIDAGFRLVWDFGTVHGLTRAQQQSVGREIDAVAAEDASVLLLVWSPGRRGPLPHGMSRVDVEEAFAGWTITDEEPFDATGSPHPLRNTSPRVYRLRR